MISCDSPSRRAFNSRRSALFLRMPLMPTPRQTAYAKTNTVKMMVFAVDGVTNLNSSTHKMTNASVAQTRLITCFLRLLFRAARRVLLFSISASLTAVNFLMELSVSAPQYGHFVSLLLITLLQYTHVSLAIVFHLVIPDILRKHRSFSDQWQNSLFQPLCSTPFHLYRRR